MNTLQLLIMFILFLPSSYCDDMSFDDMTPLVMKRMEEVRKVLLPVPQDMLDEAVYNMATYYIPVDSETELCRNHSSLLFDSFIKKEIWALRIVDASSKVSAGGMDGNMMDLGSFDQCLSVAAPGRLFTGKHCVVETKGILPPEVDLNPERDPIPQLRFDVIFSVCVPSSCTAQDVKTHMDVALNSVNASAIIYNSSCSSAQPLPYTKTDYLAMFVICVVVVLVLASSYYDHSTPKSDRKDLMISFSLKHNTEQMLSTSQSSDSISCLHGLRVFSMAWVMLSHRFTHLVVTPNLRPKGVLEDLSSFGLAPMQEFQLPVEIFLLLSGLLITYGFMKDRRKNKPFNYLESCITRYRRLTPVLTAVVLLYSSLLIHVSDGPIYRRLVGSNFETCVKYWWTSLLYIANYVNPFEICNGPTWYLNVDFQLHLLAPLLLVPLHRNKKKGMILATLVFLVSLSAGLWYAFIMKLPGAGPFRMDRRFVERATNSYVQTQYKAGSFLMGIILGDLLFKIKKEQLILKMTQTQLWLGWIMSGALIFTSVFGVTYFLGPYYEYNPWVDICYNVIHRYTFSLGVAWVILACSLGHGGIINKLLSWPVLIPPSRLTYCAYLLHWAVQTTQAYRTRTLVSADLFNMVIYVSGIINKLLSWPVLIPLSRLTYCAYLLHWAVQTTQAYRTRTLVSADLFIMWYLFAADFTISYSLAALLFVTIESPVSNVFNCVFSGQKKKVEAENIEQTINVSSKDRTIFCTRC